MLSLSESGVAMAILAVRHITTYQYKQPVAFGEHRMMLRPRECHDQRVLESKLEITPKPMNLRWTQDLFGNHVAIARFAGRAQALRFESTVQLDHLPTDIVDMEIDARPWLGRFRSGKRGCRQPRSHTCRGGARSAAQVEQIEGLLAEIEKDIQDQLKRAK
jgi:transglutaminase-like putative cysteine protease